MAPSTVLPLAVSVAATVMALLTVTAALAVMGAVLVNKAGAENVGVAVTVSV